MGTDDSRLDKLTALRIPFDSINLAAVIAEAQLLVGGKVDSFRMTDPLTIVLVTWTGSEHWLLVSADPRAPRSYLLSRRPDGLRPPPQFVQDLKRSLTEATIKFIRQRGLDRVFEIGLETSGGVSTLVAELMGKHSNVMLVNPEGNVVAAMKWVGPSKSVRPILPNRPYQAPPFAPKPSLLTARPGDDLFDFDGTSPFLSKLISAGMPLQQVQDAIAKSQFTPRYADLVGAYPLSLDALAVPTVPRRSISQALEQHFEAFVSDERSNLVKSNLRTQLERVLLAREVALRDLDEAIETAKNARLLQTKGELILAYQGTIAPQASVLEAWDYDGNPISISLKPDLSPVQNAERYFSRAKKSKARASEMVEQRARLEVDRAGINGLMARLDACINEADVLALREEADRMRWLQKTGLAKAKEDRPFEGHAVRELLSPGGWRVLYGENATANDYLTGRVAKPADLWFHVRGAPSAHVVLCSNNQPARVQRADLEFAARLAVRQSPSKHSSYVSVDYTQKRYVRKPKGAAPGLAVYTHEKTLHVSDP